ncbi:hypothetical protein SP40_93 [Salmonella phage 40]|nr:hypothetical protein SP40_93 [Salmonella phage 40]
MNLKAILELLESRPQVASIESGAEPCLRTLVENYYQPHFPENYKEMADAYIHKLTTMWS